MRSLPIASSRSVLIGFAALAAALGALAAQAQAPARAAGPAPVRIGVEQNVRQALAVADRGYVLERGRVVAEGSGAELLRSPLVQRAYLGVL